MITIQLPSPANHPKPTTTLSKDENALTEEQPCEKYMQFMDSSRQERTFMIEKLIGK
ncbi:hypothetical protein BY458DRAFT_419267, partial [Sporodiniella umbellata]